MQVSRRVVDYKPDGIIFTSPCMRPALYRAQRNSPATSSTAKTTCSKVVQTDDWEKSKYSDGHAGRFKRLTDYYADYGYAFAEVDTKLMKADDGSAQVDGGI